ncbi:VOC family protein [Pyxidicoccus parkwayensis]|uniref:VOC family protein n=1 Tax=Pyxidicoccus parkwayensis TaxID=2813578 RepID=A0ABX7NZQ1_9BACT|nr:VOC family protein [Pyxidicoccus parkwaysis]QSQ22894.1 VOC family protein [Pyxidicoccus parkwaysis]
MRTPTFLHLALACGDPLTLEHFYTKHFGFSRARVVSLGEEQIVFLKSGSLTLELFKARQPSPVLAPEGDGPWYPGWRHLAFSVDDVDATLAELGPDARVTLSPQDFDDFIAGWRSAWVADPEGNIIEISQGYVDEQPPPRPWPPIPSQLPSPESKDSQ